MAVLLCCRYLDNPQQQDSRLSIDTTSMVFGMTCAAMLGLTALLKVCHYTSQNLFYSNLLRVPVV